MLRKRKNRDWEAERRRHHLEKLLVFAEAVSHRHGAIVDAWILTTDPQTHETLRVRIPRRFLVQDDAS